LPSLITKVAPPDVKGTAMGVYSSLQFLGIFIGGIIGGMAHQRGGSAGVFALTMALAVIWLIAAAWMAQPSYLTTRLLPIAENKLSDAAGLQAQLRQLPGVAEAVIIAEEGVAYLKVDSKIYNAAMAEAVAGSPSPA
jgi:MFS family permease